MSAGGQKTVIMSKNMADKGFGSYYQQIIHIFVEKKVLDSCIPLFIVLADKVFVINNILE